jgi:hypothetical protein
MKRAVRATYRDDPLYPRIERAVASILATGKVVAPVDVLVDMGLLAPEKLEDWRRGRVPYLEQVIHGNLITKTGDPRLEEAYARHFVWPGKGPFDPSAPKETRG